MAQAETDVLTPKRDQCSATHRVLGRCLGEPGHPNLPGWPPSDGHGSRLGSWQPSVGGYVHWNRWAGTTRPGRVLGGDDYPDGRRVVRYADADGCVGQEVAEWAT